MLNCEMPYMCLGKGGATLKALQAKHNITTQITKAKEEGFSEMAVR
jgi:hypothetical protein